MKIEIYTNNDKNECAIAVKGDQIMRAATVRGIFYPHFKYEYEIEDKDDFESVDPDIKNALRLHIENIDNCSENFELVCCTCQCNIDANELHLELVLYAGEDEIGMVSAMHNECED